jgi:hypothetical protein
VLREWLLALKRGSGTVSVTEAMVCHPERSEGSSLNASQILRFAQNDNMGGNLPIIRAVRKLYQYLKRANVANLPCRR